MKITTMSHENHIRQAINWLSKVLSFQKLFWINQRIKTVKVADWVILSIQTVSFYSFHLKTVRSPIENRTFSIWKPYGFHMENVKRRQFETDTEPFNHTLICICQTNLSEKLRSCFEMCKVSVTSLNGCFRFLACGSKIFGITCHCFSIRSGG